MSASSGGFKNDVVQILMLSFMLCAVFFGIWGGFMAYKARTDLAERDTQQRDYENLQKLAKKSENKDIVRNYRRREETQSDSESLYNSLINTSKKLGPHAPKIDQFNKETDKTDKSGVTIRKGRAELAQARIEDFISFLRLLEDTQPQVNITRIKLNHARQRRGEEEQNLWSCTLWISTYVSASKH